MVECEVGNSNRKEQQNVNQDTPEALFLVTLFLFDFISQLPIQVVQLQNTHFSLNYSLTNRTLSFPVLPVTDELNFVKMNVHEGWPDQL